MINIQFSTRQNKIIEIVKENQPISSEQIASILKVTRATLRTDLSILTMTGVLDARPKVGYFYTGESRSTLFLDQIKDIKVKDFESTPVVVDEGTSVYNAIVTLFLEDVGTIFVTSKGYLAGVVSRKDFLKSAIGTLDINKVPVGIIMTRMPNIVMTYPEESMYDVAVKIINHQVDSLPVVYKEENEKKILYKVVGKISKTSIASLFVDLGAKG
ncbi:helix-turn-helix transcriptional regulator [Abyssisolibacter fermentans]|uniref:helix-turn-helix transcriptional regulator n=1 Tax=Abyssisolibacter fermentans TaxID=1766203 RepID=UPI00083236B5|nr:helix-turn-helix transcriptional regulator [Abyssisolibacter fermentans]